ncbi:phosphopantetheine-binding protein [Streptomyces sp. bgisy029]|uniref:phosphopantetheine-binding protein n=1 Tax=Streptomyces sp. bgisy029 TaxID=3413771 RepID=UPI003D747C39
MNPADVTADGEISSALERNIRTPFDDNSPLAEVGLHSLSVLRIAGEVITDPDREIDPSGLAAVRTVGDLRQWLQELRAPEENAR